MKIVSEGKQILMVLKIEEADICASWMTAHNRLYEFKSSFCVTLQLFDPLESENIRKMTNWYCQFNLPLLAQSCLSSLY